MKSKAFNILKIVMQNQTSILDYVNSKSPNFIIMIPEVSKESSNPCLSSQFRHFFDELWQNWIAKGCKNVDRNIVEMIKISWKVVTPPECISEILNDYLGSLLVFFHW